MKKMLLTILCLLALTANAFAGAQFSRDVLADFTLHTYVSDDPMGDVSFLVETDNALVVVEPQAFSKNIKEFQSYTAKLNKPVKMVLVSFHAAGLDHYPNAEKVTSKPMDGFMKSEHGKGMLAYFAKAFKGAMDTKIVNFDTVLAPDATLTVDGVIYRLSPTAIPGMPGSLISINDNVLYQHFAPAAGAHVSPFQVKDKATLNGALTDAKAAQQSNHTLFIGSHYPGKGTRVDLDYQVKYLEKLQAVVARADNAETVIAQMQAAYPNAKGAKNLNGITAKMYQ